jgi:hypothetical protein
VHKFLYVHSTLKCKHDDSKINSKSESAPRTSSLDISIPADVVKDNNVHPGDVFEVTTTSTPNEFRITYKGVYSQPRA